MEARLKYTFTYDHPSQGPIHHKVARVIENKLSCMDGSIVFEDDQGRTLSIQTNAQYVLRGEQAPERAQAPPTGVLDNAPTFDPDEDNPNWAGF
jgi:hypothetical protein